MDLSTNKISRPEVTGESMPSESKGFTSSEQPIGRDFNNNHNNSIVRGQLVEPMDEAMNESNDIASPYHSTREIIITPLSSGYTVRVGCQTVAVETNETLIKNLAAYLENPNMFERAWNRKQTRNKLD